MSDFEVRVVPPQPALAVAVSSKREDIAAAMGRALSRAYASVATTAAEPAGPPFARYFSFGETVDFEAGVPIAQAAAATGGARPTEIGGGEDAVAKHVGPYDTLDQTYVALMAWIEDQGRKPAGPMWESYLTSPDEEPDPAMWLTEIHVPLEVTMS